MTAAGLLAPPPPAAWEHDYPVTDLTVIDADTYDATLTVATGLALPFHHTRTTIDHVRVTLRLAGADAPDPKGSPAELEARAYVLGWLAAHRSHVRARTSKPTARPTPSGGFGRWLALLYAHPISGGLSVLADELKAHGLAVEWTRRR